MASNEDKHWWYKYGETLELAFIGKWGEALQLQINPEKQSNPCAPDLIHPFGLADLKTQREPFNTCSRYGKEYQPNETVTFNRNDAERYYRHYPDLHIYFWVLFPDALYPERIYAINMQDMFPLLPHCPEHFYKNRVHDTQGNAKSSFLLRTDQLVRLSP